MPADLYSLPGCAPCGFVRLVARHLGVKLNVKDLDFSKNDHLADDFVKNLLFCKRAKPTKEQVYAFEENVLKSVDLLIGDDKFAVGENITLADLSIVAYLVLAFEDELLTELEDYLETEETGPSETSEEEQFTRTANHSLRSGPASDKNDAQADT
ncbi:hypothetical protein HPB48_013671 [Haemaphysalis longicornis]|uniref:GST N-terminal domain-containing protein n=1 Tax=Haemaphysalis longicornis TaxID=44386 RepID=A0A9J6GPL1_HAELO|nr:hypothetical protein HPB48_013671 [Haemaphysalis longicornis]